MRYIVAIVQHPPVFLNRDRTISKMCELIAEAAGSGARLVVFPESYVPGYPVWLYGTVGWDDPTGKRLYRLLLENSLEIPSDSLGRLQQAAAKHRVFVVAGVSERDVTYSRGSVFNSLVYIGDDGSLLGTHRKLVPTHAERMVWAYGDGRGLRVHESAVGRLGGLICWEHWMPLSRYALHASGEQVHVAVWPVMDAANELASRHYAFEGRCYVLAVSQVLSAADMPSGDPELRRAALAISGSGEGMILPGGSGIIGPDGDWMVGPANEQPAVLYGEIDLDRIAEEQLNLDTAGHYSRPDIFALTIDRNERPVARFRSAGVLQPDNDLKDLPRAN